MISVNNSNTYMKLTDEMLLEALKAIRTDPSLRDGTTGICSSIDTYFRRKGYYTQSSDTYEIRSLMSCWQKFSGKDFYPIPSPNPSKTPHEYFHECHDMWNQETEYGKLRWELLEFCIQRLEDRIYEDKVS